MLIISKEQAACIFYCQAYNKSNAAKLTKRIEEIKYVGICYFEDPTEPILVSLVYEVLSFKISAISHGSHRKDKLQEEK